MTSFFDFLKERLNDAPLPGRPSQLKMAPEPVTADVAQRKMDAPDDVDSSSVLILLFPNKSQAQELVLTLRTRSINHGGQISFPGGRAEEDESAEETALREAKEEIGIHPADVKIAGRLSKLYVSHSDNYVTPVVGFLNYTPRLTISPDEVEEAFSVEIDSLLDKKNLMVENWDLQEQTTYKVPFWDVHRVPLWGATAMMLSEFLDLYRAFLDHSEHSKS
jgi:8-oxo-dGTP pyrophosphatase MutT (NUDIX family)